MELWIKVAVLAVLGASSVFLWQYIRSGRHPKARREIQLIVAATLRETNQGTFMFIVGRNAKSVEVQINGNAMQLRAFGELLSKNLRGPLPKVRSLVLPLQEDISHIGTDVVVWGTSGGDVYVARSDENPE